MFTTKKVAGHGWCIFCAKTAIMLHEGLTWEGVLEFARAKNLSNREYDRENDEVILY